MAIKAASRKLPGAAPGILWYQVWLREKEIDSLLENNLGLGHQRKSVFENKEQKMAGRLNMLPYHERKLGMIKTDRKEIKTSTFLSVADTSVAVRECCCFHRKTKHSKQQRAVNTLHTLLSSTEHILLFMVVHFGTILWSSVQMSFSCDFETYIPADIHVENENSEEEKKKKHKLTHLGKVSSSTCTNSQVLEICQEKLNIENYSDHKLNWKFQLLLLFQGSLTVSWQQLRHTDMKVFKYQTVRIVASFPVQRLRLGSQKYCLNNQVSWDPGPLTQVAVNSLAQFHWDHSPKPVLFDLAATPCIHVEP